MTKIKAALGSVALLVVGIPVQATSVTVQELGTTPTEVVYINSPYIPYSGYAYAGVVNLKVNGIATDGFCIDPFHFSNSSSVTANYDVVSLKDAPKPPGPMGAVAALEIEKLWGYVYSLSPTISAADAAGLQIAIWEVVAQYTVPAQSFSLGVGQSDYGAAVFRSIVESSSYNGPVADLVGLESQSLTEGQDYVIRSVPDGGTTLGLLGIGFVSLALIRSRKASAPVK